MLTHIHPLSFGLQMSLDRSLPAGSNPTLCSGFRQGRPSTQSSFARIGRYPLRGAVEQHLGERYFSVFAHTSSCARPPSSHSFRFLIPQVFAGWCQSLLNGGPSRRYLCNPWISAWTPTPPRLFGARTRFFPKNIGLSALLIASARETSRKQLRPGVPFRGCSHSLLFRLLSSLAPPIAPTTERVGLYFPFFSAFFAFTRITDTLLAQIVCGLPRGLRPQSAPSVGGQVFWSTGVSSPSGHLAGKRSIFPRADSGRDLYTTQQSCGYPT